MKNIVLLFPGVGSQYVGMGKSFYDSFRTVKETFEEASDAVHTDLAGLCFTDAKKELSRLENSQIALVTVSVAAYRLYMQQIGLPPAYCMGHSLGEISALCCAGVLDFKDALKIVKERGNIINRVAAAEEGTMAWVINLDTATVESVCREASENGKKIFVSAYDTSNQSSISGHTSTVMEVAKLLEKEGAIVYPLKMSGPFHSPLMHRASEEMQAVLRPFTYREGIYPVIANSNARPYAGGTAGVIENLSAQLVQPVRWKASIDYLLEKGVNTAIEAGPKNVLKFLMEKNTSRVKTHALDNVKDLEHLEHEFIVQEDRYLDVLAKCLSIAVSTRNLNENSEAYQREVVQPYKKIESLYQELEARSARPTLQQLRESIQSLGTMLQAKKILSREREQKISQLLDGKVLKSGSELFNPTATYESA